MMAAVLVCMFLYVRLQDSLNLQVGRNLVARLGYMNFKLEWAGGLFDKCIAVVGVGVFLLASPYGIGVFT
jgi:hypothetical protein